MQRIRIQVVRSGGYRAEDGWQVYGDGGTGQVDWQHPLTSRRYLFWPEAQRIAGHLLGGHLRGLHLDGILRDGHLEGTHLLDEHLLPAFGGSWESRQLVFGRFKHAVVAEDARGNKNTEQASVCEKVINSDPPPPGHLKPLSFDSGNSRFAFGFVPSDRLMPMFDKCDRIRTGYQRAGVIYVRDISERDLAE
jgi:hypothetical protein